MPRANRFYEVGYIYHITHRCNHREFLLAFKQDKLRYRYWLYQAVKRYRLLVLNYMVTDNHIHLLVVDTGGGVIANSMRFIASRLAFDYHQRKNTGSGAFWQGRYFATAVQKDQYLLRCMIYIDLNMVRCGVVRHPQEWNYCGYHELFNPRKRYRILAQNHLLLLLGFSSIESFLNNYNALIDNELYCSSNVRDPRWSECSAVGDDSFIEEFNSIKKPID
jgi:putative transposase